MVSEKLDSKNSNIYIIYVLYICIIDILESCLYDNCEYDFFFVFQTKELKVWIRKDRYWLNCKKNFWSPNFLLTESNLKKLFSFKNRQFFFS